MSQIGFLGFIHMTLRVVHVSQIGFLGFIQVTLRVVYVSQIGFFRVYTSDS